VIVDYIDAYRHRFGVAPICAVLCEHGMPIAPSTYYAAKARGPVSDAAWAQAHAANTVHQLYVAHHRLYGVRKMWHARTHPGHEMGRDQVVSFPRFSGDFRTRFDLANRERKSRGNQEVPGRAA
jgi:putative transposase